MQFYIYALGFLVLGVMFALYEYAAINYPIHVDDDIFDTAFLIDMGVTPFLLIFALVALTFMVSEILQHGTTLSAMYRNHLWFVSGGLAAIISVGVMSYNNDCCFES